MLNCWFFISPYAIMMSDDNCLIAKAWKLAKGIRKRSKMKRGCKMLE